MKKEYGIYTEHLTPDMLFGAWLEYWYKYHCKTNIRQTTRGHYERAIRLHIIPKIGDIPLSELTQSILQKFYLEEKQSGRLVHVEAFGEGLSDNLIRHFHALCSASLQKAVELRLIDINPAKGCKIPSKKPREMKVLSHEEIERFLIQAKADGFFEAFLLEFSTGLRRGELAALQWNDLNLKTGELSITKQLQRIDGELVITRPKTRSSTRTLVIPTPVLRVLAAYKETVDSPWLFPSPHDPDLPLSPCAFTNRTQRILERAECKQVRFHDLRHTFATLALEEGMDVKTLSAILGHMSSDVSLDVYAHTTSKMQQAAASTIDRRIAKSRVLMFTPGGAPTKPEKVPFVPKTSSRRKPGTGCIVELNDHLFEGRYAPRWVDGTTKQFIVYAKTRDECEEKLQETITQAKSELEKLKKEHPRPEEKKKKIKIMV